MNQNRKMLILRLLIIARDEKSRSPEGTSLIELAIRYGKSIDVTYDEVIELLDLPLSSILKGS